MVVFCKGNSNVFSLSGQKSEKPMCKTKQSEPDEQLDRLYLKNRELIEALNNLRKKLGEKCNYTEAPPTPGLSEKIKPTVAGHDPDDDQENAVHNITTGESNHCTHD